MSQTKSKSNAKHSAMSVKWEEVSEAIQQNPNRNVELVTNRVVDLSVKSDGPDGNHNVQWLPPGWTEDAVHIPDPVSLSLWIRDPLYRIATDSIRRSMEMEEAAWLLEESESAWKSHNGRGHGWVRKHIEEDLRQRSAGGDSIHQISWDAISSSRRAGLLMDYVCCLREFRVMLWWPDKATVTIFPLTDPEQKKEVYQLNCLSCHMLLPPSPSPSLSSLSLLPSAIVPLLLAVPSIAWTPPMSAPPIGSQTISQLQTQIVLLDPTSETKGNRSVLWNRLMWLTSNRNSV